MLLITVCTLRLVAPFDCFMVVSICFHYAELLVVLLYMTDVETAKLWYRFFSD